MQIHEIIKKEADHIRSSWKDFKAPVGEYMNYVTSIKVLRNELLNSTNEQLKDKLKALDVADGEIKKLKTKKELVLAVLENL